MKVVILGAGQVGHSIARYLSTDENEITVVDSSGDVLNSISDKIDIKPVQGFASHPGVLERAQIHEADLLVAVTASDEVNMVACEMAHSLFDVKTKIARIRHQDYLGTTDLSHFYKNYSIDVIISPEVEVAKALARSTEIVGAFEVFPLANDQLKMIAVHVNCMSAIINTPIRFLNTVFTDIEIHISCIVRGDKHIFPGSDDAIALNDEVYFTLQAKDVNRAMKIFGFDTVDHRKIAIVGGGNIGMGLALQLEHKNLDASIRVIEKSAARCTEAARLLNTAQILNGDALDLDVLAEANVPQADTLLALTDDDKVNILVSLLAKQQGTRRTVSLLNKTNYSGLVTSLGVDAVVNPRAITVSTILQYVCQGRLQSVHSIANAHVEVIEAEAKETSNIIGLTISDITLKGIMHVVALVRDGQVTLTPTRMLIQAGDILVIIVQKDGAKKAERLFHERPFYL